MAHFKEKVKTKEKHRIEKGKKEAVLMVWLFTTKKAAQAAYRSLPISWRRKTQARVVKNALGKWAVTFKYDKRRY